MFKLVILLSDVEIIDYSSALYIIEDIFETYPIEKLESLFDLFEENLKSKTYSVFTKEKRNLTILKIANFILKRLSSSVETQFRGKVQMAIASVFPISDKSGVNQKGLYNNNNITYIINNNDSNTSTSLF